jgi:hypothetical protein
MPKPKTSHTKKDLYRKVNTTARGVSHLHGSDYKYSRSRDNSPKMKKGVRRGLDYTPLFRFLLSKVGGVWSDIYTEAKPRLVDDDPIFWMVSMDLASSEEYIRVGESSYYSGLYVSEAGILCIVNADITEDTLAPLCKCCTHTFNGKVFGKKYDSAIKQHNKTK